MRYQIARALFVLKQILSPVIRMAGASERRFAAMIERYIICQHHGPVQVPWEGDADGRAKWEWKSTVVLVSETTRHDDFLDMGWHGKHERCALCGRNFRTWQPV